MPSLFILPFFRSRPPCTGPVEASQLNRRRLFALFGGVLASDTELQHCKQPELKDMNAADPFEQAIAAYTLQLNQLELAAKGSERVHPNDMAQVHLRMGCAFNRRRQGVPKSNLATSLRHLQKCIGHFERHQPTLQGHLKEWATAHVEVGNVYVAMIVASSSQKDLADYASKASHYYQMALGEFTQSEDPDKWGLIQLGMGRAHAASGDHEVAFTYFENALEVQKKKKPVGGENVWAQTHHALAETYLARSEGHLQANIDGVLQHSKRVILILDGSNVFAEKRSWAACHRMMALAYAAECSVQAGIDTTAKQLEHVAQAGRVHSDGDDMNDNSCLEALLLAHVMFMRLSGEVDPKERSMQGVIDKYEGESS